MLFRYRSAFWSDVVVCPSSDRDYARHKELPVLTRVSFQEDHPVLVSCFKVTQMMATVSKL